MFNVMLCHVVSCCVMLCRCATAWVSVTVRWGTPPLTAATPGMVGASTVGISKYPHVSSNSINVVDSMNLQPLKLNIILQPLKILTASHMLDISFAVTLSLT